MEAQITMLMQPLSGVRLGVSPTEAEDGSILGFRRNGDEVLFAYWDNKNQKAMCWIPVSEFSPDPEAIMPPEILEQQEQEQERQEQQPGEAPAEGEEEPPAIEKPARGGPFGGVRRRKELER